MKDNTVINRLSVVLVSIYLFSVAAWLLLTRQIPSPSLGRLVLARLRRPYSGDLDEMRQEQGHCWLAALPSHLLTDQESASCLMVFENGKPLGPAHAAHEEIRRIGGGRFSHWGGDLFFSTSDNTDPRTNGRNYRVKEVR
ncbi:hypothetical protein [Methyloterricola oryzae]|jgi:hypothetical protein|uniref:hypothetical protein n=1 Tax=Methyloterricola oryzae TaxID=1495050 RepID=UPI0011AF2533|nr:hypothetical protein [Methyloterricola oryzae]